jgi:hypothetical protein
MLTASRSTREGVDMQLRIIVSTIMATAVVGAVVCHAPRAYAIDETVLQFRSEDDASVAPDPAVCLAAPFTPNLPPVEASFVSQRTRARDGVVMNRGARRVGTGTACLRINDFFFTPFGTPADLFGEITIDDLTVRVLGTCTVTSNNVPIFPVILATCAMKVVDFPAGFLGGSASSNSVFNPAQIPGFSTGSYWTLRLYTP